MSRASTSSFEQAQLWDSFSTREAARVHATLEFLPEHVDRLLDVGCGDGRLLDECASRAQTAIGVDLFLEPLRRVKTPRGQASALALPFPDSSFDLVVATEFLEHLDRTDFVRAIDEMVRVSRAEVLLSVPFNENLWEEHCRCGSCGDTFHRYGHTRAFDKNDLAAINSRLRLERMATVVPIRKGRTLTPLYWLQQRLGGLYEWDGVVRCPGCGGEAARPAGNVLGRVAQTLIWRVDRHFPRIEDGWLVARYSKQGSKTP